MENRRLVSLAALLACVLSPHVGTAEPLRMHARGGPAMAVGGYQGSEFGVGVGATLGLELPMTPRFGLAGELGGVWLSDGNPPPDPGLVDAGAGAQLSGALALHYRPWNTTDLALFDSSAGFWSSASAGLSLTGGLQRFMVDLALGYDLFLDSGGNLGAGPMLGWVHVFQPDTELRPEDANILTLGIHVMFDGVERTYADTDGDGLVDPKDKCPTSPEDKDGFDDEDGCPELDNDRDGVPDDVDHCPLVAEDKDGFEDEDGCPELDNDRDGIVDTSDKCPLVPEDKDGFEDEDGCPDEDNDQDGIKDPDDVCPNEPETQNGYADHDGCPDAVQVRVVGDKIVLDDKVHFATNSAVIRSVSYGLLGQVAELIGQHPDYVHIEVQGHADRRGDPKFNLDLSHRRAESVMKFLIEEGGLSADRLSYQGFGSQQPLVDKDTEWAWFMNRRVEFKITRDPNSAAALAAQDGSQPARAQEVHEEEVPDSNQAPTDNRSELNTEVAPW